VDSFGLPGEGFLTHGALTSPESQETLLHPLNNGEMLNAISIPVDVLAFLTRELVLPVENARWITWISLIFRRSQTAVARC
jgi:hypothetical protein